MKRPNSILLGVGIASILWAVFATVRQPEENKQPGAASTTDNPTTGLERVRPSRSATPSPPSIRSLNTLVENSTAPSDVLDEITRLTLVDPEAAANWLLQVEDHPEHDNWRSHLLFTWAGFAPENAAAFLAQNPRQQTQPALLALLGPWLESDPEAAVRWTVSTLQTIQREAILPDIFASLDEPSLVPPLLEGTDHVVADEALQIAVRALSGPHAEPDEESKSYAQALIAHINDPLVASRARQALAGSPVPTGIPVDPQEIDGDAPPEPPSP